MGKATVRLSLKTIAMRFPPSSIERIYLHGKWQQSRGRNPSMTYGNHKDTRDAFLAAEAMVGRYFDDIRSMPYSRQWPWGPELVAAIINRHPLEELGPIVWYE